MTHVPHRQRHIALHCAFDELLADWLVHTMLVPLQTPCGTNRPIKDLSRWSYEQTLYPTPLPGNEEGHDELDGPMSIPLIDNLPDQQVTLGALMRTFEDHCMDATFLDEGDIPHGDIRVADRALGHMRGQAEKVYLGACRAFMIRPADDWFEWAEQAMQFTCAHYGLICYPSSRLGELWGCREGVGPYLAAMERLPRDSTAWHLIRAQLCGIAPAQWDTAYHLRQGHGVRCEPDPGATYR